MKTTALVSTLLASTVLSCHARESQPHPMQNIVTYTVYADGPCNNQEMIPAFIGKQTHWFSAPGGNIMGPDKVSGMPFPNSDLWVLGYGLSVQYLGMDPSLYPYSFAMTGIENGLGGDYLSAGKLIGPGDNEIMFPLGFAMALTYGDISQRHVDMHINCPQGYWYATLTLYTVPKS